MACRIASKHELGGNQPVAIILTHARRKGHNIVPRRVAWNRLNSLSVKRVIECREREGEALPCSPNFLNAPRIIFRRVFCRRLLARITRPRKHGIFVPVPSPRCNWRCASCSRISPTPVSRATTLPQVILATSTIRSLPSFTARCSSSSGNSPSFKPVSRSEQA